MHAQRKDRFTIWFVIGKWHCQASKHCRRCRLGGSFSTFIYNYMSCIHMSCNYCGLYVKFIWFY
jgi:hypothetical protein